jgi:hypothetical protein
MGRVKEFAMWLAESIYLYKWSDEQIITSFTNQHLDSQRPDVQIWLHEQIQVVRENPKLYQSMFDIK